MEQLHIAQGRRCEGRGHAREQPGKDRVILSSGELVRSLMRTASSMGTCC